MNSQNKTEDSISFTEMNQKIAQQCLDLIFDENILFDLKNLLFDLNKFICQIPSQIPAGFSKEFLQSCLPSETLLETMSLKDCLAYIWKESWKVASAALGMTKNSYNTIKPKELHEMQIHFYILSGSWIRLMSDAEGVESILNIVAKDNFALGKLTESLRRYLENISDALTQTLYSTRLMCTINSQNNSVLHGLNKSLSDHYLSVVYGALSR